MGGHIIIFFSTLEKNFSVSFIFLFLPATAGKTKETRNKISDLFHDRGPYHNIPIDLVCKSMTGLFLTGISVMKELNTAYLFCGFIIITCGMKVVAILSLRQINDYLFDIYNVARKNGDRLLIRHWPNINRTSIKVNRNWWKVELQRNKIFSSVNLAAMVFKVLKVLLSIWLINRGVKA